MSGSRRPTFTEANAVVGYVRLRGKTGQNLRKKLMRARDPEGTRAIAKMPDLLRRISGALNSGDVAIYDAVMKESKTRRTKQNGRGRTPAITAARTPRRFAAYFSDNTSPLKSALTIRPVCSPASVSTAPLWLARTMPCAPLMMAAPAPPWP